MYPYIKLFNFNIPTYGLCICLAFFLCAGLSLIKARKNNFNCNDLLIIFAVSIGFGMLGGNLLYILITYDFDFILEKIISGNIAFFQKQGTVFYGGLIGGVLSGVVASKLLKIEIEELERCVIPYIPLGHAIGRIGCLLAGCCYGFSYTGLFAVHAKLYSEYGTFFPIQIVESLINLLIMMVLLFYVKNKRTKYSATFLYLIMYSISRFFLEFFRGDIVRGRFLVFSTSQWISLIIFLISLTFLICKNMKLRAASDK